MKKEREVYETIKATNSIVLERELMKSEYFREVKEEDKVLSILINERLFHKSLNIDINHVKHLDNNKNLLDEVLNGQFCEDMPITIIKYLIQTKEYYLLKGLRVLNTKDTIKVEFDFAPIIDNISDFISFKKNKYVITKYIEFNFDKHIVESNFGKYLDRMNYNNLNIMDLYNFNIEDEEFFMYQICNFPKGFEYYLYNLVLLKLYEFGYKISNKFEDIQINNITESDLMDLLDNRPIKRVPKALSKHIVENSIAIPFVSFNDIIDIFDMKNYYVCNANNINKDIYSYSLKEIMKKHNIKYCDSYKELVIKKLDNIPIINNLESYGFSINHINYLINNNRVIGSITNSITLNRYLELNSAKQVFKKLTSVQNINICLNDCDRLLSDLLEIEDFDINILNFDKSVNNLYEDIKELHLDLVVNKLGPMYYKIDKIGFENLQQKYGLIEYDLPLDYTNKVEEVVFESENLEFILPLYAELVKRVGLDLKLCIDTYIHKIRTQKCVLVLVKKNNQYIGCLELDTDFECLVQAKAYDNSLFSKENQLDILDFCSNNEIEINTRDISILLNNELLSCGNL